jgi:uncharacterized protein (UPF0335 family)
LRTSTSIPCASFGNVQLFVSVRRLSAWHPNGVAIMSNEAGIAGEQLRAFVERIERMEDEKTGINDDIKEIYAEAKGTGFDVKVIRQILRLRKQDPTDRQEQEAILDLYMHALGMAPDPDGELA